MENKTKDICLYGLNQLALIIICKSDITYSNQVGGLSCMKNCEEGVLSLIFDVTGELYEELSRYTLHKQYLRENDVAAIDDILKKYCCSCFLTVDRDRLKDSMEAWVYVDISYDTEIEDVGCFKNSDEKVYPVREFRGFTETKGVLTWDNSD